jgi:hypothetical protein
MRIRVSTFILIPALLGPGLATGSAQTKPQTTYGVTVSESKPDALAKVKTYTWTKGQPSPDKDVDAQIIAAVDRESKALGLTKLATGRGDAEVSYASQRRTDADVTAKPSPTGTLPTYPVGVLVVQMRDPTTLQMLFNAKVNSPIDAERSKLEPTINAVTTALFEKYPRPGAKR